MNVSMPDELAKFIREKVKSGLYENAGEVVRDALRGFRERDRLLKGKWAGHSSSTPYAPAISGMGVGGEDIMDLVFIVTMEAANDANEDLKTIMAEVKAMTAAKKRLREFISRVNKDLAANAGQKDKKPPLDFSTGMGSEGAYHQAQIPVPDTEAKCGFRLVPTDLRPGRLDSVEQLRCVLDDLKGQLDSMGEMTEMTSLRLQMVMDRRSKFIQTLSNIMKKITTTQDTLVQNLK